MTTRLEEINIELEQLFKKRDELNSQIIKLRNDQKALSDKKMAEKDKSSPLTLAELLQVHVDGLESTYLYKKREEYFRNLKVDGIRVGMTYYPETDQQTLEVCIKKEHSDKQLNVLVDFLESEIFPALKPVPNSRYDDSKASSKKMRIFEHNLSAGGVYSLVIDEGNYKIVKTTYRIDNDIFESQSLMEILKYIRKHHWY